MAVSISANSYAPNFFNPSTARLPIIPWSTAGLGNTNRNTALTISCIKLPTLAPKLARAPPNPSPVIKSAKKSTIPSMTPKIVSPINLNISVKLIDLCFYCDEPKQELSELPQVMILLRIF